MCAQEGTLLLTGIINPQVVRTAEMVSSQAIVFVRCKIPLPETVALAEEKGIYLMACKYSMFETCGRLFAAGWILARFPNPACSNGASSLKRHDFRTAAQRAHHYRSGRAQHHAVESFRTNSAFAK